jgi:catechol 2,3-dioxygenase-like lactoylglutathione lyase family enzyme
MLSGYRAGAAATFPVRDRSVRPLAGATAASVPSGLRSGTRKLEPIMPSSWGAIQYVAPVLRVAALARSLAFYRDRLGFTLEWEYDGFYACVVRDGCRVHLNCSAPVPRDQHAFEAAEHLDACFVVTGAAALSERFAAAGATFSVPLRTMPYGQEFYVRDPDGYILGFVEAA